MTNEERIAQLELEVKWLHQRIIRANKKIAKCRADSWKWTHAENIGYPGKTCDCGAGRTRYRILDIGLEIVHCSECGRWKPVSQYKEDE